MLKRFGKYELIAFVIGFAMMGYELTASRILAPAIGSSTYVWTSVIAVIIAALSLGYAAGGILADRRARPTDLVWLLLLSGLAVAFTLILAQATVEQVGQSRLDERVKGIVCSLILFMPTSFLLGMISPYLAKLRTTSLARTGRSVAGLSAFNAVGGIIGTMFVGFVLFGYTGSKETLAFIVVMLLATSWLVSPIYEWRKRAAATAVIMVLGWLPLGTLPLGIMADIDTPTARYQVTQGKYYPTNMRALIMGPSGSQSAIVLAEPTKLVFEYTKQMDALVAQAPNRGSILVLGGGAFTLPAHLADEYPGTQVDVVEIDPQLKTIAKQYFNYRDRPNVAIIDADARTFLQGNTKQYDIVLVDVYHELSIPYTLTTTEYARYLRKAVKDNGVVMANVVGADNAACAPLLRGLHASYSTAFADYRLYAQGSADLERRQNLILVYSPQRQNWLPESEGSGYRIAAAAPFTDNFAPVERLVYQCEAGDKA